MVIQPWKFTPHRMEKILSSSFKLRAFIACTSFAVAHTAFEHDVTVPNHDCRKVAPVAFQQPTTTAAPTAAPTATSELVSQWTKLLKESPYPAQREQAAHTLATHDWRANPQVLTALIDAAKNDPAASVRVGCVYALGRTSAATETVFGALQSLRSDSDERVRQEVDSALSRLQRGSSSASAN